MADYENLLDSIDAVIKSNNRREITGQILQNTLHQMVGSLGENYQLAGFATPTLDPNSPDQNVFYVTDEAGVYTNFDNITLGNGLSFLMWKNGAWSSKTMNIVTAQWVNDNFVSKAFLRQMFRAYDEDGVEIFANDTTSIIDNIKAMCGLWTNQYLSALGLGADGGGGASTLAGLNDVNLNNLQDGQALVYDLATNHWVNRTIQSGVDMSVVWAALAAATNEQINVSHLTTALSGYVTSTALATTLANYVTSTALAAALADYATQSWVETNYVSKSFFNSLFQAEDSEGNAIVPNNSGQTAIDRLKILVGAYTDQYLSALGLSEDAGASSYLYGLGDVQLDTQTLAGGQALVYSAALGKWTNGEAGVNMAQVWTALATADSSKQIDASHISTALASYVTSSSLATTLASYVTTSSLSATLADYVTSTALSTTLADYGTKSWVNNNYVSIAFFNRLFRAFAPVAEGETEAAQVEPNDTTTTIENIKAMFGLWTEQYLSALGLGSDAGHTIGVLNDLNDVTITNPQTDQVLKYNGTQWVNAAAPSGASALSGLTDVAISTLADKDLLQWDYATGKWKNVVLSTVMSAYALASSIPTNVSQLTNDSGYVTSSGVTSVATGTGLTGGTITSTGTISIDSTYQTYISHGESAYNSLSNYLPLSGGDLSGRLIVDTGVPSTSLNTYCGIWVKRSAAITSNYANCIAITTYQNRGLIIKTNGDGSVQFDAYNGSTATSFLKSNSSGNELSIKDAIITDVADGRWAEFSHYGTISLHLTSSIAGFAHGIRTVDANGDLLGYAAAAFGGTSIDFWYYGGDYTTPKMTIYNNTGNVGIGIGTTIPAYKLQVGGGIYSSSGFFKGGSDNTKVLLGDGGDSALKTIGSTSIFGSGNIDTIDNAYSLFTKELSNTTPTNLFGIYQYANTLTFSKRTTLNEFINAPIILRTDDYVYLLHAPKIDGGTSSQFLKADGTLDSTSYLPTSGGTITGRLVVDTNNQSVMGHVGLWVKRSEAGSTAYWNAIAITGYNNIGYTLNATGDGRFVFEYYNGSTNSTKVTIDSSGNLYAVGGVSALSDERHKDIVGIPSLSVEQIATARSVLFKWKDRRDNNVHVGSIAQDWEHILPESIRYENDKDRTLSLQYGVAALISSITIARKVVNHEQRITELEKECERLRFENEQLRLKIA